MPCANTVETRQIRTPRSLPLTSPQEIDEFILALVGEFIRELVADVQKYDGVERRAEPRFPISIPVEATPYDLEQRRTRAKFVAVTRDISASGVTFLHSAYVEEDFWILEFLRPCAQGIRLVVEVLYRRPIGPFWEIAGRFVTEPPQLA